MHLNLASLLGGGRGLGQAAALLIALAVTATASTSPQQHLQRQQTSVTLRIPASHLLPNPGVLPPSTHATLSALGAGRASAPLTAANTLVFGNVSAGSYLVDVHCATHAFAPLRVDVVSPDGGDGGLVVRAWETFRGNDWDNKGEAVPADGGIEVRVLGQKNYFMERSKFNAFSILKNPMILLGLVSMCIFIGMPYLVDNMDPEMRAEWEERQKTNPMNGIMGAATGQPGASSGVGNFDMAAFLAGTSAKKGGSDGGAAAASSAADSGKATSGKGGENNRKKR
ncbi:hypothetical protein B0T24DRAFT_630380 [Lasiosphaeria ovina]|uniref:ER membrane protein complex subunit 7 beta-sandwich domain-containing protein n=1 Tax=Lasiosphaeria ovina TaxID=92902 RepID=A0AAE0N5T2_9PEZI|nr:hypothetical protein B0T24DRAFT_630380 [Lasiosphaeria ovina]